MYNWYQSIATVILSYTQTQITIYMAHSPCFLSPLASSLLLPFPTPSYLLGTLLAVTGSVHVGLRLLVNWPPLSQPSPQSLPLQIPRTQVTQRLTKTTLRRIWRLLSGTHTVVWLVEEKDKIYECSYCSCNQLIRWGYLSMLTVADRISASTVTKRIFGCVHNWR
jgi:hypothetical protein